MGYRKLAFDVTLETPEGCLGKRQFGYVCLECDSVCHAQEIINYISLNKGEINFIIRSPNLICRHESIDSCELPLNAELLMHLSPISYFLKINS